MVEAVAVALPDGAEKKLLQKRSWALVYPHLPWLITGFLGAAMVGVTFPIWGLLLANVQDIFFYHDTTKMRNDAATNAVYFIELGICSFIGFVIQVYCVAQVRISSPPSTTQAHQPSSLPITSITHPFSPTPLRAIRWASASPRCFEATYSKAFCAARLPTSMTKKTQWAR